MLRPESLQQGSRSGRLDERGPFMNLLPVAKLTLAAFLLGPFAAQAQEPAAQRVRTAQLFNRPPAGVQGDPYQGGAGDSAGLLVRIDRLEKEVRSLTGQLEQMQFQTRRLEEQLRRSQGQGESDGGGRSAAPPQRRGETLDAAPMGAQQAAGPQ
ncbi:MAG: tol-pal system protein YbgF, partial [Hyphomicrobiales bacterium]|nr:tol-pal system protein YbgF [Hyphomicrobiales bacterium]